MQLGQCIYILNKTIYSLNPNLLKRERQYRVSRERNIDKRDWKLVKTNIRSEKLVRIDK